MTINCDPSGRNLDDVASTRNHRFQERDCTVRAGEPSNAVTTVSRYGGVRFGRAELDKTGA
jgi:hypothetical protein